MLSASGCERQARRVEWKISFILHIPVFGVLEFIAKASLC